MEEKGRRWVLIESKREKTMHSYTYTRVGKYLYVCTQQQQQQQTLINRPTFNVFAIFYTRALF